MPSCGARASKHWCSPDAGNSTRSRAFWITPKLTQEARAPCASTSLEQVCSGRHSEVTAMKHEMCSVCSFDGSRYSDQAVLAALRGLGSSLKALLGEASQNLRVRPDPDVRSAIEYAANSRDITAQHVFWGPAGTDAGRTLFPAPRRRSGRICGRTLRAR